MQHGHMQAGHPSTFPQPGIAGIRLTGTQTRLDHTNIGHRDRQSPTTGRQPSTSMKICLAPAVASRPPDEGAVPGPIRTPPPIFTPSGLNWPFLMIPVISIVDPS